MNILTVDDERIIRLGIEAVIRRTGKNWTVVGSVSSGQEAIHFMDSIVPDVIITDIHMEDLNGIDLGLFVKRKYPDVMTIVISGYPSFQYAQKSIEFGVLAYLTKPTQPGELEKALTKAEEILLSRKQIDDLRNVYSCSDKAALKDMETDCRKIISSSLEYIADHYGTDIKLSGLASMFHMNPSYFSRLFKQETGINAMQFLVETRIRHAKELLRTRIDLRICEVSEAVGYSDSKYFSQLFKREVGMTPAEYRESN